MKHILTLLGCLLMFGLFSPAHSAQPGSAYDFTFKTLEGEEPLPFSQFRGKVVLVVNTASECGFTPQYDALEKLYKSYESKGFVILGVPSNDFGGQEPGNSQQIAQFCKARFGVTFPLTSKETVSGDQAHPFYIWAKKQLGFGTAPKWNFHKYLIDRHGKLVDYFNSPTKPDAPRLIKAIQKALDEPAS